MTGSSNSPSPTRVPASRRTSSIRSSIPSPAVRAARDAVAPALARALIRAVADDPALEVPSPTFTLVQTYAGRLAVAHFDLYRLSEASELDEIGFEDAIAEGAALVEWPERAEGRLAGDRLDI